MDVFNKFYFLQDIISIFFFKKNKIKRKLKYKMNYFDVKNIF